MRVGGCVSLGAEPLYLWRSDRQREKAVAGNGAPLAVAGVGPVEFAGEGRLQQLWRRW